MSYARGRCWTGIRFCFGTLFVLGLSLCASTSTLAQPVELSIPDRVLLAEYRVIGRKQAPLLLATTPAHTGSVAARLSVLGAEILARIDKIGYLYALAPVEAVSSILQIHGLEAIQVASLPSRAYMAIDASSPSIDRTSRETKKAHTKGPAPTAALGADNPFTGEAATQALDFKSRHPTFDGRGVVTAFVEPVAPGLATMRGALDGAGRPLLKFAHYEILPPAIEAEDAVVSGDRMVIWQRTEVVKPNAAGAFTWRGRDYRLPKNVSSGEIASVRWRICRRLANQILDEYDVLWAENRQRVWVISAAADGNFSDARSVSLRASPAAIAIDPPAAAPPGMRTRELVFAADRRRGWLTFAPTMASHAGMVGSVMAGSGFMDSKADGVAPAAQISIYLASRPLIAPSADSHAQILAMLTDRSVDVAQASIALGDTSRFGSASIQSIWADRLIAATGKPFVKAAGNHGSRLNTLGEFEMAQSVFAVGAYVPRMTWRANMGIEPAAQHVLASYSGWGPARDGGLKPDFLSLTHTLSEGSSTGGWYWNADAREYGVSGGTSASAPHGAGHIALLVSAAKQAGIPHDAPRLRAAIATTAHFFTGIEARAQGHGLIQVSDAWEALKRAQRWVAPSFEVRAPLVGQETRAQGPQRHIGRGLFELSGWKPRQTGRRELTVTRTGGARTATRFQLQWKGHTDVFRSELREIELPLGRAVTIPVDIRAGTSGSYSAILDLIDPQAQLVAGSILNTVMVADELLADGDGLRYQRASPRPGTSVFYIDVPPGLAAVSVSLAKDSGKSYWAATDPTGRMLPFPTYGTEIEPARDKASDREQYFVYQDPIPGVWQFAMTNPEPRSMADLDTVEDWSRPMPLVVRIQGWTRIESAPAMARASQPIPMPARANGSYANIEAVGLGAARVVEALLSRGIEPRIFELQVDPGTTGFDVQVEHADPAAQVGLYVFKVPEGARVATTLTSDHTALIYRDTSFQRRKRYRLDAPPPGKYAIAIDPIRVAGPALQVAYRDIVRHPLFGSVTVRSGADEDAPTATMDVRARPADERKLHAEVDLLQPIGPTLRAVVGRYEWFVD